MVYSNTSLKDGLLQHAEFLCNLGDAGISGVVFTKAQFTNLLNRRYERATGILGGMSTVSQFDDTNYTNHPFSLFDLTSGTHDYQFLTDASSNAVTDITAVLILPSTTATEFVKLDKLTLDNEDAELMMSPNSLNVGVPSGFIERNNTIFFNTNPNYTKAGGGKLFYKRVPSYFVVADTTKQPGFNAEHHQLLSLGASYDWLLVNKPENTTLITRIEAELTKAERSFKSYAAMRNPHVDIITAERIDSR